MTGPVLQGVPGDPMSPGYLETAGVLYGGQPDSFMVQAAGVGLVAGPAPRSWIEYQHPEFREFFPRWRLANAFYNGDPADPARARWWLVRRYQGEADQAYSERLTLTDFTPWLGTLVDTLGGMLWATDDKTVRVWNRLAGPGDISQKGTGYGEPDDPDSFSARLLRDANGHGESWVSFWRSFSLDIILNQMMWVLVDTVQGLPCVKLINPMSVPNWVDGPTGPVEVLMKEMRDPRKTLKDVNPEAKETYIRWTVEGWERWMKDKDGNAFIVDGLTPYHYEDRNGNPTLPIFKTRLPVRRYVTWLLAKKAFTMYNQESVRDHGLRSSNFGKLVLGVQTYDQFEDFQTRLLRGENVLAEEASVKGQHRYIAPSDAPVTVATAILAEKEKGFYQAGFKMLADSAKEKTATEIRNDVNHGVGAYLQLVARAMDDAENRALWLLGQAEFSDSPERWKVPHVQRTDDFTNLDLEAELDRMRVRYLGETTPMPVGRKAIIKMAKEAAAYDGLPVDEAEIAASHDAQLLSKMIANLELLNVTPPKLRARMMMRLCSALGLVDAAETFSDAEGEKKSLYDEFQRQAEELAELSYERQKQVLEMPPAPIPAGKPVPGEAKPGVAVQDKFRERGETVVAGVSAQPPA